MLQIGMRGLQPSNLWKPFGTLTKFYYYRHAFGSSEDIPKFISRPSPHDFCLAATEKTRPTHVALDDRVLKFGIQGRVASYSGCTRSVLILTSPITLRRPDWLDEKILEYQ